MIDKLIEQLKRHEGFRSKPYKDTAGHTTIGYGHNLDANPLTKEQAEELLQDDLMTVIHEIDELMPWVADLDEVRQAVVYNMAFNLGTRGLLEWPNTLRFIKSGKFAAAATLMRSSLWRRQVGQRAIELANQLETGMWA